VVVVYSHSLHSVVYSKTFSAGVSFERCVQL
jgi:hypothetical protein